MENEIRNPGATPRAAATRQRREQRRRDGHCGSGSACEHEDLHRGFRQGRAARWPDQIGRRIQGADKLLKLLVDIGDEVRQVLAGIALAYAPEELVGRKVVIVANLAPRKMRGLESNGMLLAASARPDGKPVLCTFAEDIPVGSKVK